MALPTRKQDGPFEGTESAASNTQAASAGVMSTGVLSAGDIAPHDAHARALHRRLAEVYGEAVPETKLPLAQRVGIIVGSSAALWGMIGAGVALAF